MHTITHIEGIRRHVDIDMARAQIMGRLTKYVFEDKRGQLRFGTKNQNVKLFKIDWKKNKQRESIITKLLHKKGNVAETIYDLLGVRIVTERLCDVMVVIKLLRDLYMITFPNCNPGRARNSLLDTEHFRLNIQVLRSMLEEGRISAREFSGLVERVVAPIDTDTQKTNNPHSSSTYRSVQLTCRQLIKVRKTESCWQQKVSDYLDLHSLDEKSKNLIQNIVNYSQHFSRPNTTDHGYFPFEIHLLDKESFISNKEGEASHDRYKSSQARAARRR